MTDIPSSPDLLQPPPTRGAGVRRLNRIPLMMALVILVIIMATIAYTYHLRLQASNSSDRGERVETAIGVLNGAPEWGFISPKAPSQIPVIPVEIQPAPIALPMAPRPSVYHQEWEDYVQRRKKLRQAREQVLLAAIDAATTISAQDKKSAPNGPSQSRECHHIAWRPIF